MKPKAIKLVVPRSRAYVSGSFIYRASCPYCSKTNSTSWNGVGDVKAVDSCVHLKIELCKKDRMYFSDVAKAEKEAKEPDSSIFDTNVSDTMTKCSSGKAEKSLAKSLRKK